MPKKNTINLNTAKADVMKSVGFTKQEVTKVMKFRRQNGRFLNIFDLKEILSKERFKEIKSRVKTRELKRTKKHYRVITKQEYCKENLAVSGDQNIHFEHIIAKKNGGAECSENYIRVGGSCNMELGNEHDAIMFAHISHTRLMAAVKASRIMGTYKKTYAQAMKLRKRGKNKLMYFFRKDEEGREGLASASEAVDLTEDKLLNQQYVLKLISKYGDYYHSSGDDNYGDDSNWDNGDGDVNGDGDNNSYGDNGDGDNNSDDDNGDGDDDEDSENDDNRYSDGDDDLANILDARQMESIPLRGISFPIGLKADEISSTSAVLSWQPPYNASDIRGYQVSYTRQGGSEHLHEVQNTTSTELTSLEPNTEYIIRVRAKTVHFEEYSTPITIHTAEANLLSEKLPDILGNYKNVTFKQLRIVKLIFYGTPRAGKTTLRKQLMRHVKGLRLHPCGNNEPSTNLAEMCSPIFVERIIVSNEENDEWKWTVQKLDDIAKALLLCLDNEQLHCEIESSDSLNTLTKQSTVENDSFSVSLKNKRLKLGPCLVQQDYAVLEEEKVQSLVLEEEKSDPSFIETNQHEATDAEIDIYQFFLSAVKAGQWAEVVSALNIDKAMFLQIIDGGGQPSFQEIFPLLLSGPSITLLIFKLTDGLETSCSVQYQPEDGHGGCRIWHDTYVVKDIISHALSSFVSQNDNATPFPCKLLLVGTHKDKLDVSQDPLKDKESDRKAKIESIAVELHGWLHQSKAFESIHVRSIEDLITGIDNSNEDDIAIVKRKIEELIAQLESQDIPAPWLVFDFVLHKYAKEKQLRKVEKSDCKKIASKCSVKDDEINLVLHYLHFEAGTLLYYSDIPILNQYVITDFQLIFDSISKVIIQYFDDNSVDGPHMKHKDLLKQGQLEQSVLKNVEGCLEVNELLSLLQHRHIISKIEGTSMYFMPSVLPKIELSTNVSSKSSFLVLFGHDSCPVGLFCATTTRLIIAHKWKLNDNKPQYRNKIHFHCTYKKRYNVVFSAFSTYYEVCLMEDRYPSQVKYMIYQDIDKAFGMVCKDMKYSPPSYGFYCPETCEYGSVSYSHPATCAFSLESQEMICLYGETQSDLAEEQKQWFSSQEQTGSNELKKVPSSQQLSHFLIQEKRMEGTPTMPELVSFTDGRVSIAVQIGVNYLNFGMFLLKDNNGAIVTALENEHQKNAERISRAILQRWLQGGGEMPVTWSTLVTVLQKIGM